MHLANELLRELDAQELSADERAILCCGWQNKTNKRARPRAMLLRSFAKAWGVRPNVAGLDLTMQAHTGSFNRGFASDRSNIRRTRCWHAQP